MEMVRIIAAAITVQVQQTRRDIEDLLPLLTMPLFTLIFMAILNFFGPQGLEQFRNRGAAATDNRSNGHLCRQ